MDQDIKSQKPEELEFTTMPKEYRQSSESKSAAKIPQASRVAMNKFLKFGAIIFVLLVLLGGGGYLLYGKFVKDREPQAEAPINPIQVPEPPPENLDSDNDGLSDSAELKIATNSRLADTDGDGLADGDEGNIYKTDPLLSDSDGDGYDDGGEVARGYSPIVKVSQKAGAEEIKSWSDRIAIYKLHEPTPTTLKLKATNPQIQSKVTYTNAVYKYTMEIPAILTFRETDEGRLLGIYISGTNPEEEVASDPINASVAVKVASQSLKDWVESQYQQTNYELLRERDINGLKAISLIGIKDEVCPQNKTFFVRDNTIIILTWTCNQNTPFAELYEQIAQSFKFQ